MLVLHKESTNQCLKEETTRADKKGGILTQTKDLVALSINTFDGEVYTCLATTRTSAPRTYVADEKPLVHKQLRTVSPGQRDSRGASTSPSGNSPIDRAWKGLFLVCAQMRQRSRIDADRTDLPGSTLDEGACYLPHKLLPTPPPWVMPREISPHLPP